MKKVLNAVQLKGITLAMMIGGIYLQQIVYRMNRELLAGGGTMSEQHSLFYHIGYVVYLSAFPVAAFLLVEGCKKTSDKMHMQKRLLLAAVAVEIPMDVVAFGLAEWKNWGISQNYFFTLALGLGVLLLVEKVGKTSAPGTLKNNLITVVIYMAAAMIAVLGRFEQGSVGVLTIIALNLFYGNRMFSLITVAALYILFMGSSGGLEYIPALGILITWLYNGETGKQTKWTRVLCYGAFPVAYCILGIIVRLL